MFLQNRNPIMKHTPQLHESTFDNNCLSILNHMGRAWEDRAQVKQKQIEAGMAFSIEYDDFLDDLLPFHQHPLYEEVDDEIRTSILSAAWIAYNEKTIDIESKIITPVCNRIIYSDLPGVDTDLYRWLAAETLVDESYHILMVLNTCRACRSHRDLMHLRLPDFELIQKIDFQASQYAFEWQRDLLKLAACIVSEVFISDYLSVLSNSDTVQPINRMTTEAHRQDELAHSKIFDTLAKEIFVNLSPKEKDFFCEVLPLPVRWFASKELPAWESALNQIGFKHTREVIGDCQAELDKTLMSIDYSELITLATNMGILDTAIGQDAFEREGLLNNAKI